MYSRDAHWSLSNDDGTSEECIPYLNPFASDLTKLFILSMQNASAQGEILRACSGEWNVPERSSRNVLCIIDMTRINNCLLYISYFYLKLSECCILWNIWKQMFLLLLLLSYIYIYIPMAHNHSECLCMGCGGKTFLLPLHHRFVIVGQPSSILALGIHWVCRILL